MASADLRAELDCSICLNIYTDPVALRCGHNFCRVCIHRCLDTQEGSGGYSCPECRETFQERPALQRNIKLHNIVDKLRPLQPDQEDSGVFCTHCIHSPVPAVKSCLYCEASLCDDHLRVHSKEPKHVLCDPTTSLETRKCSVHKKILEYYCTEDSACICVYCSAGEHRRHQVEMLDEASKKKKKKLRNVLQKLRRQTEETEKRLQSLQERRRKAQKIADVEKERITALITDLKRRLEDLEERSLSDISKQAELVSISCNEVTRHMEIKKEKLSRKIHHIEELCNMTDPLTVLQEPDTGDVCDTEEGDNKDTERLDEELRDEGDLDVAFISHTLHVGLSDIIIGLHAQGYIPEVPDILLDVKTAGNDLHISTDRKTASRSDIKQNRPETPLRFQDCPQVLSSQSFSSGRHYWEVDVGAPHSWRVGVCYPSISRKGMTKSLIGYNDKSWCLCRTGDQYSVVHNGTVTGIPANISSNRVRICLHYETGQISFYDLCNPIRHLHTFTATFTEPLHAVLCVWGGRAKICGGNQKI